jgi:hypothetical protein
MHDQNRHRDLLQIFSEVSLRERDCIVALNMALQALFGAKGVPPAKPSRSLAEVQAVH